VRTPIRPQAGQANIFVLASVKFTDGSTLSVADAVAAAAATGARVLIYIEDTGRWL
jgi:Mrp family chromosome partitioning ATPase